MEQHLRAYFGYPQDDWTDYLFLAKFAANNQISDTTSMSPILRKHGFHPKYDFELDIRTDFPEEIQAQTAPERLVLIHS